ncbi:Bll0856 protein [hydrothermal vent metagenome]|uniref:Bll0856 protein n=1 Tax=hydrothermal vent metagenome TaxID=652676 RepID=A0A1W1CGQ1_9ZZZZ
MNIWITTDLHFKKSQFEFLVENQDKYDILTINGDLLNQRIDFEKQTKWINSLFRKIKKPVFICSGNHDLDAEMEFNWLYGDNLILDNKIKTINGIKFGVVPFMGADFSKFYDCDILLYHIPPKNTKTATLKTGMDLGCDEVYQALKHKIIKPKYLLCGHLHTTLSKEDTINQTKIINPNAKPNAQDPLVYELNIKG